MKSAAITFLQVSALAAAMSLAPSFAWAAETPVEDNSKQIPECVPERILFFNMPYLNNNPITTNTGEKVLHKVALKQGPAVPYELCYDARA